MKIVIATAVYYPMTNGVAVFSHNLAAGLARRGHEVLVICPSQTGRRYTREIDGVKTCYLKSVNVKVYPDQIHAVPAKRKVFGRELPRLFYKHGFRVSVFPGRTVKKILDEFLPDVVHVQVSDPIGLSVVSYAKKNGVPVVTTEHNEPDVFTEPLGVPKVIKQPIDALLRAYFVSRQEKSDFVTMPSQLAIRKMFAGKDLCVPVKAVSNGVDLSAFRPGKASSEIYEKYDILKGRPTVLYVGRVDPEKKVETVIRAFRKVLDKVPEALLVVVGDGVDRIRLEKEAKRLGISGAVRFLGKVLPPDLYELYLVGDVFATASEIETQGIVLIEAAACGLPLVAVNAGAVAEVCRNNENGFLIEKGENKKTKKKDKNSKDETKNLKVENEMAEDLVTILTDEKIRERFSVNSVKIAHEHDFEKTLDEFIKIYQEVIN